MWKLDWVKIGWKRIDFSLEFGELSLEFPHFCHSEGISYSNLTRYVLKRIGFIF